MTVQGEKGISWTDETWNPIRGCQRVDPACQNCYAEVMAHRFSGPGQPYEGLIKETPDGPRWNGEIMYVDKHLLDPLRWTNPKDIFTNSMSDLFYHKLAMEHRDLIVAVMMASCATERNHIFQTLTKRTANMADYFEAPDVFERVCAAAGKLHHHANRWHPKEPLDEAIRYYGKLTHPNAIWGTSIGFQESADEKYPHLMRMKRLGFRTFLSCEPLIGPVDFTQLFADHGTPDWVIAGAESGDGARPAEDDWFRMLRDICAEYKVPYHLKQFARNGIKIKLPKLDGVVHDARYVP